MCTRTPYFGPYVPVRTDTSAVPRMEYVVHRTSACIFAHAASRIQKRAGQTIRGGWCVGVLLSEKNRDLRAWEGGARAKGGREG